MPRLGKISVNGFFNQIERLHAGESIQATPKQLQ